MLLKVISMFTSRKKKKIETLIMTPALKERSGNK